MKIDEKFRMEYFKFSTRIKPCGSSCRAHLRLSISVQCTKIVKKTQNLRISFKFLTNFKTSSTLFGFVQFLCKKFMKKMGFSSKNEESHRNTHLYGQNITTKKNLAKGGSRHIEFM